MFGLLQDADFLPQDNYLAITAITKTASIWLKLCFQEALIVISTPSSVHLCLYSVLRTDGIHSFYITDFLIFEKLIMSSVAPSPPQAKDLIWHAFELIIQVTFSSLSKFLKI